MRLPTAILLALGALTFAVGAPAQDAPAAKELRRIPAEEAHQGVASDAHFVYAISDSEIGKYDKATGQRVAQWTGDKKIFIHINSCIVRDAELVCAMSNFPNLPMISSVEWFRTSDLRHVRSHSFGQVHGSLTWIDWHEGAWWANFANYDARGGDPAHDHRSTTLVKYTPQFVETEAWLYPEEILERFGHMSASGGRWGRDGRLYVTGHDLPEMYVLQLPEAGPRLVYRSTIQTPTNGQAFDWDMSDSSAFWTIERKRAEMVESRLP